MGVLARTRMAMPLLWTPLPLLLRAQVLQWTTCPRSILEHDVVWGRRCHNPCRVQMLQRGSQRIPRFLLTRTPPRKASPILLQMGSVYLACRAWVAWLSKSIVILLSGEHGVLPDFCTVCSAVQDMLCVFMCALA